jgi:hypothetical protein
VTPDTYWEGTPPRDYDRAFDLRQDTRQLALLGRDRRCEIH